jgi:hypothetical protein
MKRFLSIMLLLAVLPVSAWSSSPAGNDTIGIVRNFEGQATITRGERSFQAAVGSKLQAGDVLATGFDGSLGLILRDNSCLSIGPQSKIVIKDFLFSPAEGKMALFARLAKGTMAYMSGMIGKLAPESVRFETPVASIGIRGTYFVVSTEEVAAN